jgi:alkylation response protein AidB-like acyl-CoA dehydrogenase
MHALDAQGWAVPHWPLEWGGTTWPATWRAIFSEELVAANTPPMDGISTAYVAPVLYTFGNDEQKRRYLPPIRRGEEAWCQGFSEASAGSDLTALKTVAARTGDHFVVNGRKLWVTSAHYADMMFALVRIDSPGNRRQQGLSFLLIDMRSPGVAVRPIITIDGVHRVNEVALETVAVPVENLVGEEGKGWIYARFLLDRERSLVAHVPVLKHLVARLRATLCQETRRRVALIETASERLRLAQLEAEIGALEFLELRFMTLSDHDDRAPVLASMLKLRGSELRQRVSEALWEAYGERGLEFAPASTGDQPPNRDGATSHWSAVNHLYQRSASILGGTSEIQKNLIAGAFLGL